MFRLNKHILRYILNNPSETYTTSKGLHTFYNNNVGTNFKASFII